jgi:predicted dinucleotide-binding enzyme
LGTARHNRGHHVTLGVRNADDPKHPSLGAVWTNDAAASDAEVVVLCTPWHGTQQALRGRDELGDKVLIDATNPRSPDLWIHLALCRGFGTDFGFLRGRA